MSADAGGVRLNEWRELSRQTGFGVYRVELVVPHHDATEPDLVAWPAAQAAAMERVVEAARAYRAGQTDEYPRGCDVHRALLAAVEALDAAGEESR